MIKFLAKGLLRDRSRSLFPVLVIILTVTLVIFSIGFMQGTMNSLLLDTAVIFTGHETKVMKNSEDAEYKMSRLERLTNKTIQLIFLVMLLMALTFGFFSYFIRIKVWDHSQTPECRERANLRC